MEETREDIILAKMDKGEKICIRCKHYVEHRIPRLVAKYGDSTGFCASPKDLPPWQFTDSPSPATGGRLRFESKRDFHLIVEADSSCNRYESLF